jgi:hypothetical protein
LKDGEACALFHCSAKACCIAVWTTEATFGRSQQILRIMGKRKWLHMKGCEFKGLISVTMEIFNSCQDWRDVSSVCLGITLKNNDSSGECVSYMLCCDNLPFNCYDVRKLGY